VRDFLKEIIRDPITGQLLVQVGNKLQSGGKEYPIVEDVPVLLTDQVSSPNFDYKEHYRTDGEYYDYFKSDESFTVRTEMKRLHQAIIHKVKGAGLILDVGCGGGWVARHFTPKAKVVSMDVSVTNPVRVLKEFPNVNHAAVVADVFTLPFKKESFDCIIASEVMEHVYDPKLFIEKLVEALKPGGKLIITTPYNEKIEYYICIHCNKPTPKNAHLHSFNKENIKAFIPADDTIKWKTETFANKYFIKLRLYNLTAFVPYIFWKIKDKIINAILGSPTRLLIQIVKK
jgi:2-polyprenyl-3-methyl-5-hydroxy-6-metoxy-1,4-benzoquinol methylase